MMPQIWSKFSKNLRIFPSLSIILSFFLTLHKQNSYLSVASGDYVISLHFINEEE